MARSNRPTSAMDGFIRRPTERKVGGVIGGQKVETQRKPATTIAQADEPTEQKRPVRAVRSGISRSEIDASLDSIDSGSDSPESSRKVRKPKTPKSSKRKWIKRVAILLVVLFVAAAGYFAFKAIVASGNVFQGSILDVFQNQPLKQDESGRSNILILGTSEDDPGHQGANLTDSMMILSIDQNKKNAYMISIPRDMEVQYGRACMSGYAGKINVYYSCVHDDKEGVDADREALKEEASFVGDIFGLDIQYGVNVNYTVMRELVNAVGGSITVTIESRDPRGQMDSNFDWKCGVGDRKVSRAQVLKRCPPNGHFIDYPNGPAKLDAEHALYLAQARGDMAPTYGFEQSNFDREKNQQKIIKALREKAVSAGTLADFGKVSSIIDALGNNLRTTFETKEFRTLVSLAQDIQSDNIKSISLIDGDNPVMNGDGNPTAGKYQYKAIRELIQKKLSADPVVQEEAPIVVLNGSGVAGVAQTEADKLEEAKYTIADISNAPAGTYPRYTLYQVGSGNTGTAAALKKRYGIEITKGTPPVTVDSTVRFVLIVGPVPASSSTN